VGYRGPVKSKSYLWEDLLSASHGKVKEILEFLLPVIDSEDESFVLFSA
jgi:hypothetical protein